MITHLETELQLRNVYSPETRERQWWSVQLKRDFGFSDDGVKLSFMHINTFSDYLLLTTPTVFFPRMPQHMCCSFFIRLIVLSNAHKLPVVTGRL